MMTSAGGGFILKLFNHVSTVAVSLLVLASAGFAAEPSRYYALSGRPTSRADYQIATECASRNLYDQACELIERRDYQQAIEKLEGALALTPDIGGIHANLGLALNRSGKTECAIDHLKLAVQLSPHEPAPLLTLASCYQRMGKLHESYTTYSRFVSLFPSDSEIPLVKGILSGMRQEMTRFQHVRQSQMAHYASYASSDKDLRWAKPDRVLNVFISKGEEVSGTKPIDALVAAFDQWQKVGCFSFQFVGNASKADIVCRWSDDASTLANPAEGGEAKLSYKSGIIRKADLTLLTTRGKRNADRSEVAAVALHEIGHCLGIVGHSPNPSDIMYFSINIDEGTDTSLSPRDIETLKVLYPNARQTPMLSDDKALTNCEMGCLRSK